MPALRRSEPCVSDLTLDRQLSDELAAEDQRALSAHLTECVRCSVRYDVLRRQHTAFLAQAPDWDAFAASRHEQPRRSRLRWVAASVLAAAALVALALPRASELEGVEQHERIKGPPRLGFFVKRGARVLRGASGDVVHPGDVLRFSYSSGQGTYFALLDADATTASVFYPEAATSVLVEPGRNRTLDFAVELDAQLGPERLFGVFCDAPLTLEPVRAVLQASRSLPSLPGCRVDTLVLHKRLP